MLRRILLPAAWLAALAFPAVGAAATVHFTAPVALPGSLPSTDPAHPQRQGGEPSVAFDPDGRLVYVAAPGAPDHGGNFWRSLNGGRAFQPGISVGAAQGGGDSDIAVGYDAPHTVFNIDLEMLAASDLCRSTDHGQTFPDEGCDTGTPTNQKDAAADRPWLTTVPGHPDLLYITYDGLSFGGGAPEVERSTDKGATSTACGQVLEPGSDAFAHFSPTGAAENSETIGKPALDGRDGSLYVPFTEPHTPGQQASASDDPTGSNLYMAIGRGGCPSAPSTFRDVTVYKDDAGRGSSFVSIFPSAAVDGAGTVYALGDGRLHGDQKGDGVYLFVSRNHGQSFSAPIKVNEGLPQAAQLGSVAGGLGAGEAVVGWYSSDASPDHNSDKGRWYYHVAVTYDFGKTWERMQLTPDVFHYGNICNLGVTCPSTGNRNLLDFSSVGVNPVTGCAFAVIPGDPFDTPANGKTDRSAAYTSVQDSGACLTPANSGRTAGAGGAHRKPARARLRVTVRPAVAAPGCRRYAFRVTRRSHGHRVPVGRVRVTFLGGRGRTNRRGATHFKRCIRQPGRYRLRAHRRGFRDGYSHARVRRRPSGRR